MYLTLFIILALVSLLCAQSTNQTNLTNACAECVCAVSGNSTTFARGNTAYLCAHFISVNQNTSEVELQRAAFPIVVDDFTSVQLQGGQTHFNQFNYTEIVVQLHGSIMSTPLTYIQMTPQQFYSSAFSVVIQVNLGVIQSVIWDHQCATCGSSDCFAFSTASGSPIDSICNTASCVTGNDSSCDPQIFVTWIGTDVNNAKMTSAGMRLSLFREFSTADLLSANTIPAYVIPNVSNSSSSSNSSNSSNSSSNSSQGNSSNQTGNETNPNESGQNATINGTQNTTNNNTQQNEDGDNTDNENDNSTNTNNNEGNNQNQGEGTQTGNENGSQSGENTNTNEETNQNGSGENTNTNEGGESQTGNENDGGTGGTNGTTPGTGSETGSGGTNTETGGNGGTDETDTEGSNTSGESQNPSQITN